MRWTRGTESAAALWIASALAACSNAKAPPPCAAVGARLVVLAQADLEHATLDDDARRLVLDQLPAMRDSLVNACRDGDWDPQIRTCMMEAVDHAAFEDCERTLTGAQREVLERGASGER